MQITFNQQKIPCSIYVHPLLKPLKKAQNFSLLLHAKGFDFFFSKGKEKMSSTTTLTATRDDVWASRDKVIGF